MTNLKKLYILDYVSNAITSCILSGDGSTNQKKTDTSLLASFFFADEELNSVAAELDSFDGRKDPERCTALVNKLRSCQDKVLVIIQKIIDEAIPVQKASRDFRVKFPDDVLQENLAGQLWFGAECLAAGSSIMNREIESASMRPLARALTKNLDSLRTLLRDQCFRDLTAYTDRINEALIIFDKLFAEFELSYVSTMVPVKSMREYDLTQEISVLFSETVQRALKEKLITQEMIDDYDPSLMFTIPRFAIICGLYVYPDGPLNPDQEPSNISEMFRPFQTLLLKIKELLQTLTESEMKQLEKSLCSSEDSSKPLKQNESSQTELALEEDCGPSTKLDISIHTLEGDECDVVESPTTPVAPAQNFPFPSEHSDGCTFPEGFTKESLDETLRNAIDETLRNSIGECQMRNSNLNKSESRDSGLHSENVSTSETISFDPNSVISVDALCTCAETSSGGQLSQEETTAVSNSSASEESICFRCNKRLQKETNTQTICSDIIHYLVETSLDICLSQSNVTNERQYSRQSSWQYNVNIEIPRSSELPDHENASSNSDSSTSTLSTSPSICHTLTFGASSMTSTLAGGVSSENTENSSPSLCDNTSDYSAVPIQASSVSPAVPSSSTLAVLSPLNPPDHSGHSHDKVASSNSVVNEDPLDIKPSASNQKGKSAQKTEKKSRKSIDRIHCKTGPIRNSSQDELQQEPSTPRIQRLRYPESVSSSFSSNHSTNYDSEWDRESGGSSETSSYNSESNDDEEIALAIKAAEVASKKEARSRFRSSSDLIHRLFVCISGVADQLQTNYAGDLRHILKCVFDMNCSEPLIMPDESTKRTAFDRSASFHTRASNRANRTYGHRPSYRARDPPQWTPDDQITVCLSCQSPFTFIRRRHHCRNCGKIYCGRCSANFVPLPHFGFVTPVRVCNRCLMYQVTPFTVND